MMDVSSKKVNLAGGLDQKGKIEVAGLSVYFDIFHLTPSSPPRDEGDRTSWPLKENHSLTRGNQAWHHPDHESRTCRKLFGLAL